MACCLWTRAGLFVLGAVGAGMTTYGLLTSLPEPTRIGGGSGGLPVSLQPTAAGLGTPGMPGTSTTGEPPSSASPAWEKDPANPPASAAGSEPGAAGATEPTMTPSSTATPAGQSAARVFSRSGYDITPLSPSRIAELAKGLTDEEARILLKKGTEPAFCGNLLDNKKSGTYACRLCGLPLFDSEHKFNSGTGWPSFFRPVDRDHVRYEKDTAHGMVRVEIMCNRCGGHLGHVFDDAPQTDTGLRYCLNSASMKFYEKGEPRPDQSAPVKTADAYFGGGCFWGVEDRFQRLPGVINAVSGYQGGRTKNPTYKQVCYEETGHAEVVKVSFDPSRTTYGQLLEFFFKAHDPTQLNRQGPDVGDQYRSVIFAADAAQLAEAQKFVADQQGNPRFKGRKVVTQVILLDQAGPFWPAEDYHQDYHEKHGGHCPMPEER